MGEIILIFIFFLLLALSKAQTTYTCECQGGTTDPDNSCNIQYNGATFTVNYCTCPDGLESTWKNVSGTYLAYCQQSEIWSLYRCNTAYLSDTWKTVTKWAIVATSGLVIFMVFIVIIMNCMHKSKGPQRMIHLFEELTMVVLFLAMGIAQFFFLTKEMPCKIVTIAIQFTMTLLAGLFLMEGLFAQGMINYSKPKNAGLGTPMSLFISLIIAAISTGATYFLQHKYYAVSGLSCHAVTSVGMMYGFIIPVWLLVFLAGVMAQRGLLKCVKVQYDSDLEQVYWAYKSAKVLVPFSTLVTTIYVLIMFGLDQQRWYVLILAAILNVILAFYLYVAHTFSQQKLAKKKAPGPGGIYRQCPKDKQDYDNDNPDSKSDAAPAPEPTEAIPVDAPPAY